MGLGVLPALILVFVFGIIDGGEARAFTIEASGKAGLSIAAGRVGIGEGAYQVEPEASGHVVPQFKALGGVVGGDGHRSDLPLTDGLRRQRMDAFPRAPRPRQRAGGYPAKGYALIDVRRGGAGVHHPEVDPNSLAGLVLYREHVHVSNPQAGPIGGKILKPSNLVLLTNDVGLQPRYLHLLASNIDGLPHRVLGANENPNFDDRERSQSGGEYRQPKSVVRYSVVRVRPPFWSALLLGAAVAWFGALMARLSCG